MRQLLFILLLSFSHLANAQAYIEVDGQAQITLPADFVQLHIGIDSRSEKAATAARSNAKQMAKLVNFLVKQQVSNRDMQTQQLNLHAQHDYNRNLVTGYTASRTLLVKIRQLDRIDQLLVDLAELGGNRLHGYHAGLDNPQHWHAKLLQEASLNARHKAEIVAASEQLNVGSPLQIHITAPANSTPIQRLGRAALSVSSQTVPSSTQVGDIQLHSNVRIRFALESN